MSNCEQLEADDIGCLVLPLVQYNTKELTLDFQTDISGTNQPLDLTQYNIIKVTFRHEKCQTVGKVYKEFTLSDSLSIGGANNEVLLMQFDASFYEAKMPATLKFDILMHDTDNDIIRTYINGTVKVQFVNTQA